MKEHLSDIQLSEYVDDLLPPPEKQRAEDHLASCPLCRREADALKAVASWMKETPPLAPPESFYEQVLRKAAETPERAPRSVWKSGAFRVLAAACVSVVVGLASWDAWRGKMRAPAGQREALPKASSEAVFLGGKLQEKRLERSAPEEEKAAPARGPASRARSHFAPEPDSLSKGRASAPSAFKRENAAGPMDRSDFPPTLFQSYDQDQDYAQHLAPDGPTVSAGQGSKEFGFTGKAPAQAAPLSDRRDRVSPTAGHRAEDDSAAEWRGFHSGIKRPETLVFRDRKAWENFWRRHDTSLPAAPAPAVDFQKVMAAAVFSGEKPTGGFAVDIVDVRDLGPDLLVLYRETASPPDAAVTEALTQPFHIRLIPRSPKPLRFQKIP
ncbi:MAG: protease complex subunit PrcB family protein [Elusimicrobiota bacterium]